MRSLKEPNTKKTGKAERLSDYLFTNESQVICFVVEVDGQIKGYATCVPEFSTWDAAYYMHMDCLYLKPEARRRGIGKKMMEQIREEANSKNCILIQWQTPEDNVDAIAFYKRIGAMPKKKIRFYLDL